MAERIDSFTGLNGTIFDLMSDGSFVTRTCCDYDSWDRDAITTLRDWLTKSLAKTGTSSFSSAI